MKLKNSKGFTLVELMVVVAIIGVLSAVAIPNFKKYQAKSKTSEAKLQLAAIFTNEIAFQADYDVYGTCLNVMGYQEPANTFYALGFGAKDTVLDTAAFNSGATDCDTSTTDFGFDATKAAGAQTPVIATSLAALDSITANSFAAAAAGIISSDTGVGQSQFTINENKIITEVSKGY